MKDRVVFITGGAGDIGVGMAQAFARTGAQVVISDVDEERVNAAVSSLSAKFTRVSGMACDLTEETQIIRTLKEVADRFGRIDVLINNAGLQYVSAIEDFPTEKFEQMLKIMLVAPFVTIRQVFPLMKQQQFGRIINMASINGLVGFAHKAAYNSAKHGVIGLTKVAALEAARFNITVNALCPGYVNTTLVSGQLAGLAKSRNVSVDQVMEEVIFPLVPQKRLLSVEEIAAYAVFLAGDAAGGITGQAVVIDGGYTAQ